jgi:hypothetical protein
MVSEGAVLSTEWQHDAASASAAVPSPPVPPLVKWAVIAGAVITLLTVVGMSTRRMPVGSRLGHWTYYYVRLFSWEIIWPFVVAVALVLGLLWLSRRVHTLFEWPTVAGWLAAAVPLQLLLRTYDELPLSGLVSSTRSNSFYSPTLHWNANEFISSYMNIVDHLPGHARTNMPGKTMLYHLFGTFTTSPMLLGILVIAVSNLGALLIYLIVRDLLSDRRAALYALILYVLVPGKLYFLPILNVVTPVPILLALWLHVRYLKRGHWIYAALLGPALYLTVFFEPLPLVMGIVFAALMTWALVGKTLTWAGAARLAAIAIAAFVACHVTMRLTFGYDVFVNFAYVLEDADSFNGNGRRPYDIWVTRNLWDFAICAGTTTATLMVAGIVDAVRGGIARPAALLTMSGLGMLTFLDLAGINRGETVRLWIFLAVFVQITAAWLCARTRKLWPIAIVIAVTVLQGAVGMAMIGFVRA